MSPQEAEPTPALSYEEARNELERIVAELERGATTLEESLALWQRGEELALVCTRWLEGAEAQLAQAVDGTSPDDTEN